MDGRGNPFVRKYSIRTSSDTTFPEYFVLESEEQESVSSEEVDHFRRHTRSYVKKLKWLKVIPILPRRTDPKKVVSYSQDSLLVENLEELLYFSLQEITQPLDQLGPKSPTN